MARRPGRVRDGLGRVVIPVDPVPVTTMPRGRESRWPPRRPLGPLMAANSIPTGPTCAVQLASDSVTQDDDHAPDATLRPGHCHITTRN